MESKFKWKEEQSKKEEKKQHEECGNGVKPHSSAQAAALWTVKEKETEWILFAIAVFQFAHSLNVCEYSY